MTQPNKRPHKAKTVPPAAAPVKPPRAFGAQLAGDPGRYVGRDDLQRMLAGRLPEQWRALQDAAAELHELDCMACNEPQDYDEHDERVKKAKDAARIAARAIFGERAKITHQGDPRGLPLFVAWPQMPARFRCPWCPARGLPIYLPEREDLAE